MIEIQRNRIDVETVVDSVRRPDAGAIVVFLGTVRADPDVRALDYEVYKPMALRTLTELVKRAREKFGILELSIVHRAGRVPVGGVRRMFLGHGRSQTDRPDLEDRGRYRRAAPVGQEGTPEV